MRFVIVCNKNITLSAAGYDGAPNTNKKTISLASLGINLVVSAVEWRLDHFFDLEAPPNCRPVSDNIDCGTENGFN